MSNQYFDGVQDPITTQGEITINCRGDNHELLKRRHNMTKNTVRQQSYPGGDVTDNMTVMPKEPVFEWKSARMRRQLPGFTNRAGFSTLNGVHWGATSTDEELELTINFVGVAKTPFSFDNPAQLKSGFSALGAGSIDIFNTGNEDIVPGDRLIWSVFPRGLFAGGADTDGRFGNPRIGTPRGKIRFRISPSRYNDMRPSMNLALSTMFKPRRDGGIKDVPFEELGTPGPKKALKAAQELALALRISTLVTVVRGAKLLTELNIDATDEIRAAEQLRIFSTDEGATPADRVLHGLYLNYESNRKDSEPALLKLKATLASAFDAKGVKRVVTPESRYAQAAMSIGNMQMVYFARAVHVVARRRFAVSLGNAAPGQGIPAMIGFGVESY